MQNDLASGQAVCLLLSFLGRNYLSKFTSVKNLKFNGCCHQKGRQSKWNGSSSTEYAASASKAGMSVVSVSRSALWCIGPGSALSMKMQASAIACELVCFLPRGLVSREPLGLPGLLEFTHSFLGSIFSSCWKYLSAISCLIVSHIDWNEGR